MPRPLRTIINGNPFIALIGDVHAGRKFKTNVPLHRIGEREESIYEDLFAALRPVDAKIEQHFVIMGDLFDKFQVDNNTLLKVYQLLRASTEPSLNVQIHILRGNHDLSRDLMLASSFDVLKSLCSSNNRITFHDFERPTIVLDTKPLLVVALPYSSVLSAAEIAEMLPTMIDIGYYALGHWDYTAHGEDTHNLVPMEVFKRKGVTKVFSGHIHKPQEYTVQGIPLTYVGSLQPYAHGEELPDETLYQTHGKEETEELLAGDENYFADVNLRVLIPSGESWTANVPNCLSFQVKVLANNTDADDLSNLEVGYEDFSTANIVNKNLTGVSSGLVELVHQRLEHYRNLEN
jgi:DNA repair exonuclease SbcCD nuclease subunit